MATVELTAEEARVLGCLMEKSVTTPDVYPLSLNSLVNACNQTTNREPVVRYSAETVEGALDGLRAKGLAVRRKASGERAIKYRHDVEATLGLDGAEHALVGILLLRGAQTPGELKQRTERWHAFASLEEIEAVLARLAEPDRGLVVRLERRPGQKEARWAQLLTGTADVGAEGVAAGPAAPPVPAAGSTAAAAPAARVALDATLDVHDPATGHVIRTLAADSEDEVRAKIARARAAQRAWAALPYDERALVLLEARDLLAAEAAECAAITSGETGKPRRQARNEVDAVAERIEWNVEHVGELVAPRTVTSAGNLVERVTYDPVGVVAHISAWNYPWFVAVNSIVPALLAGNAVVYKPSELATLTGLRLADVLHRAGVPRDVLVTVVGGGAAGAAIVDAGVDLVCFTGSYATGLKVARAAAEHLTPVQLELGGKDAAYVCDDVDVDATAAAVAEGVFYNAGQSCCAIERVYVHEAVFEPFVDALVRVVRGYRTGDPADDATYVGPLARPQQPDLLQSQVDDAVARGARVLVGGRRPDRPGSWFEPTVLVDVDHSMRVMREESFGPVIGVQRVRDDEEAVALMDDTEYGLTGAVFARDGARAERLLARLDTGTVYWNCSDRTTVRLPWAGRRHSGQGASLAESGVRAMVREKAWHLRSPS